jgi:hypothetical protein
MHWCNSLEDSTGTRTVVCFVLDPSVTVPLEIRRRRSCFYLHTSISILCGRRLIVIVTRISDVVSRERIVIWITPIWIIFG